MNESRYSIKDFSKSTAAEWDTILRTYADYNMHQSHGWGEFKRKQGWNVLRLVCFEGSRDAGLVQVIYKYNRILRLFILWIPGGPVVFKTKSADNDNIDSMIYLLSDLIKRFKERKYYLRIYPLAKYNSGSILHLRQLGFQRPIANINYGFTYQIDTSVSEKEISDAFSGNWRHNLKRGMEEGLQFVHSESQKDFNDFYQLYLESAKLNKIKVRYTLDDLMRMKNLLAPQVSLNLFLIFSEGKILSGRIVSVFANRAYDLISAVNYEGRKKYSTYLVIWEIINWCRRKNIEYFDLSGIDPFCNKEVFNFKKGIGGDFVEFVGEWELSNNRLLRALVNFYISKFIAD